MEKRRVIVIKKGLGDKPSRKIELIKKGESEHSPPANLFEQEEAMIAGDDIILQFEYKGQIVYQFKVFYYLLATLHHHGISSRSDIPSNGSRAKLLST